jgi:hypothetical protein
MQNPIRVYSRHETYPYLGHKFNVAGDWEEQVKELTNDYTVRLDLIDSSPLPILMKFQAIREVALSKIQHLFANIHIPQNILTEMTNKTVSLVRKWLGLNTHSTRDIIFQARGDGGLGVPNIEWVYTATRTNHLLKMLNCDDVTVREMARESLLLHMQRRKIPPAKENERQFLGFKIKDNGKLDIKTAGFGVRSDWMDLNDLCHRSRINLKWAGPDGTPVALNSVVMDPLINVCATFEQEDGQHELSIKTARATMLRMKVEESAQHWTSLSLQGKLALLPFANHSVSHSILSNTTIGEDVLIFCIKARLQVLPTKYNLAIWYPSQHNPHCILHPTPDNKETMAHILNGCSFYKGLYIARHDRLVDLVSQELRQVQDRTTHMYKHSTVKLNWFDHNCTDNNILCNIPNTPDIVFINQARKSVTIFEIGCAFDLYMDTCFTSKFMKYQPLVECITALGYNC